MTVCKFKSAIMIMINAVYGTVSEPIHYIVDLNRDRNSYILKAL